MVGSSEVAVVGGGVVDGVNDELVIDSVVVGVPSG